MDAALTDAVVCVESPEAPSLWVSSSDYMSGEIVAVNPATRCARRSLATVTGDTLIARHGTALLALKYTLGTADEIEQFRLAPTGLSSVGGVSPRSDNRPANVRGYAVLDADRGLFTRNDQSSLGVYSVSQNAVISNVDLSEFRGSATQTRPYAITTTATRMFVTLQRIPANFDQWPNAAVAVLDRQTLALIDADPTTPGTQAIELTRANPFGAVALRGSWLYVPCAGALRNRTDGAIARIDTTMLQNVSYFGDETMFGGNPLHVLALDDQRLLVVAMEEPGADDQMAVAHTRLVEFNVAQNRVVRTWLEVPQYALTAPVQGSDGTIYIGDRGSEDLRRPSGIVMFSPDGTRLNEVPISVGRPPYHLSVE